MSEIVPLLDLEAAYPSHQESLGLSPKTWGRHETTQKLLHRFISNSALSMDSPVLTHETMRSISQWLQETPPDRPYHGSTKRSQFGIRGTMKDMRSLLRWLHEEGYIDKLPKVPTVANGLPLFPPPAMRWGQKAERAQAARAG